MGGRGVLIGAGVMSPPAGQLRLGPPDQVRDEVRLTEDVQVSLAPTAPHPVVQGGAVALLRPTVQVAHQDAVGSQHLRLALGAEPAQQRGYGVTITLFRKMTTHYDFQCQNSLVEIPGAYSKK